LQVRCVNVKPHVLSPIDRNNNHPHLSNPTPTTTERLLEPLEEARLARILGGAGLAPGETPTAAFGLLDKKLGVLGDAQASLRGLFHPRDLPGVHFESYLWMRAPTKGLGGGGFTWLRRWFVLEGSRLLFVREAGGDPGEPEGGEEGGPQRTLICDVLLCSVREVTTTGSGSNSSGGGSNASSGSGAMATASAASAMAAVVGGVASAAAAASSGGADPGQLPFCFEIFSANRKSVLLQAETAEDFQGWTVAIRCVTRLV
jgi:hypothetical protein